MILNVNSRVKVKLTVYGRSALEAEHEEFWKGKAMRPKAYKPPKEDAEGWSEWPLWRLMQQLGPVISVTGELPFEVDIKILE